MENIKYNSPIDEVIHKQRALASQRSIEKIIRNKGILSRIVELVELFARQNISFRGHREDSESLNRGNFIEFLHHQARYDPLLYEHLFSGDRNEQYITKSTQNELISLCAENIIEQILSMQKVAKYYALICDETKDISCVEQASLVLRYVIDDKPTERFMGYKPLGVTNAETITEMLKSFVSELGLSLFDCRGQSYDGAAVMSGKCSGVQTRLRQLEPRALFVVCNSHALNLVVNDSCRNSYIRNMFGTLQSLHTFFNGTKRHAVLERCKLHNSSISSISKQRKLQSLSETRWNCRFNALDAFQPLNPAILEALGELSTSPGMDRSTISDYNGLLYNIGTFEFLLSVEVAKMILGVTQPFANFLHAPKLNLLQFKITAESVYGSLCEMRSVRVFADAFKICSERTAELGIEVPSTTRKAKRLGLPDEGPEVYYKAELYFAVLDEIISQF